MRGRPMGWLAAISVIALIAAPIAPRARGPAPGGSPGRLALATVSNPRPELVSGGEVLVRVDVPPHTSPASVRVSADGHDVTASFQEQSDGTLLGLVTGLQIGRNRLFATARGQFASLNVTDHSINGPVFSGQQQLPFFCQTTAFGLAAAQMPDCAAPTQVSFEYMSTSGAFKPLADPTVTPADLAMATVNGRRVP